MSRPVKLVFLGDDTSLQRALRRVQASTSATQIALQKMTRAGADMQRVGRGMTLGITLPVAAAGAAAVKLSSDFEAAMANVEALIGDSKAQVKSWGDQILKLAPQVGQTPKALAEGLYYLRSSGVAAKDAMDVLAASARGSSAGLGDLNTVSNVVTSALNAYAGTGMTATRATDILLRAVKEGKAEPAEFARSMGSLLSITSELKIPFEDAAAAVAQVTLTGDGASVAVTKVRGAMVKLLRPSVQATGLLQGMGTSVAGVRESVEKNGFLKTIQGLYEAINRFSSLPKQQKIEFLGGKTIDDLSALNKKLVNNDAGENLATMFNDVRGLQGVLKLAGNSKGDVDKVFASVRKAGGDTEKAFGIQSQTTAMKFKKAMASIQASAIKVGDMLAPTVTKVVEKIAQLVDKFAALDPKTREMAVKFALIAAALGPVIWGFGSVLRIFSTFARHPILTAVGMLVVGFITLYTTNNKFRESVHKTLNTLGGYAKKMYENRAAILSVAGGIATFLAVSRIGTIVKGLQYFHLTGVKALFGGLIHPARLGSAALLKLRSGTGLLSKAMLILNASFLASPIGIVVAAVLALGVAFAIAYSQSETFREGVHKALDATKRALIDLVNFLGPWAAKVVSWFFFVGALIQNEMARLKPVFRDVWKTLQESWSTIKSTFVDAWNTLKPVYAQLSASVKELIKALKPIMPVLKVVGAAFLSLLGGPIIALVWLVKNKGSNIATYVTLFVKVISKGVEIAARIIQGWAQYITLSIRLIVAVLTFFARTAAVVINAVIRAFLWLKDRAAAFWGAVVNVIRNAVSAALQMVPGLSYVVNAVASTVSAAANYVESLASRFFNAGKSAAKAFSDGAAGKGAPESGGKGVFKTVVPKGAKPSGGGYLDNISAQIKKAMSGIDKSLNVALPKLSSKAATGGNKLFDSFGKGVTKGVNKAADSAAKAAAKRRASLKSSMTNMLKYGLLDGLTGTLAKVKSTTTQIRKLLDSMFKERMVGGGLVRSVAKQTASLIKLAKQRDAVAAKLKSAQKNLADILSKRNELSNSIAEKTRESFDLFGGTTEDGGAEKLTDLSKRLNFALYTAQQFAVKLEFLKKRGISNELLQQIAEAGPTEGIAVANTLANASKAEFDQFNELSKKMASVSTSVGAKVANTLYGAGIQAAAGLVKGLASQEKAIEAAMMRIAKSMQTAIKRALGIRSPSRVMADLATQIPAGVALGVNEATPQAVSAVERMAGAVAGAFGPASAYSRFAQPVSAGSAAATAPAPQVSVNVAGAGGEQRPTLHIENMYTNSPREAGEEILWLMRTQAR